MQVDTIREAIYSAIDQINRENRDRKSIAKSPTAALYGTSSDLDSLGLINLIVAVEQNLEKRLGIPITLVDDRALAQEVSPFSTVETLVNYIEKLIKAESDV